MQAHILVRCDLLSGQWGDSEEKERSTCKQTYEALYVI